MAIADGLCLLVDPVELGGLPALDLFWLKPQSNLLLCALNTVRAVADVTANINGVITADSAWGGLERVGGTENGWQGQS